MSNKTAATAEEERLVENEKKLEKNFNLITFISGGKYSELLEKK